VLLLSFPELPVPLINEVLPAGGVTDRELELLAGLAIGGRRAGAPDGR